MTIASGNVTRQSDTQNPQPKREYGGAYYTLPAVYGGHAAGILQSTVSFRPQGVDPLLPKGHFVEGVGETLFSPRHAATRANDIVALRKDDNTPDTAEPVATAQNAQLTAPDLERVAITSRGGRLFTMAEMADVVYGGAPVPIEAVASKKRVVSLPPSTEVTEDAGNTLYTVDAVMQKRRQASVARKAAKATRWAMLGITPTDFKYTKS